MFGFEAYFILLMTHDLTSIYLRLPPHPILHGKASAARLGESLNPKHPKVVIANFSLRSP